MFHDYVQIYIKAGDGGNGIVAFRREKYVPMGGPAGGDGGHGGHVIFVGDNSLHTLIDFKYRQHYKADRGANGQNKNMHGAAGEDLRLQVPLGTLIRNDQGQIIADIVDDGQEVIVARGGRGGRGNSRFASNRQKAPTIAENGEPGEELKLVLELKLLADVGLIGLPNAGKSTLLAKVTAATPKIANYPFTTLSPNLGVVDLDGEASFVIADLPGLIEGAATGIGLGHRFLRHAERTRLLLHVLDMSPSEQRTPLQALDIINQELCLYREDFLSRPMLIVANKMDMPGADENLLELKQKIADKYEIFPISALTGDGLQPLLWRTAQILAQLPKTEPQHDQGEQLRHTVVSAEEPFVITPDENGVWVVSGTRVEKLVAMTDLANDDAVRRMQHIFIKMGLEQALIKAGVAAGDTVRIGSREFEYAE